MKSTTPIVFGFIGLAIAVIFSYYVPATAVEVETIARSAAEMTVRIDGRETGSGAIVDRAGNTYTVLTNWHVVDSQGSYTVRTPDGEQHPVIADTIVYLPNVDLAMVQFESDRAYPIATKAEAISGSEIYLAGWTDPFPGVPERSYLFLSATLESPLTPPEQGYEIWHDNPATPGTSGGPILDNRGHLVGINGRAIVHRGSEKAFGLGIPLETFLTSRNRFTPAQSDAALTDELDRGQTQVKAGDLASAIVHFTRAIETGKNAFNAYLARGHAQTDLANYEEAISDYTRVLQFDSDNLAALAGRAYAYFQLENYNNAIADYTSAIAIQEDFSYFYGLRGGAYLFDGQIRPSITDFDRAIALDPQVAVPYLLRGAAYLNLGEIDRALADYDRAITVAPDYPQAYLLRGFLRSDRGDYPGALADLTSAIELDENNGELYRRRGDVYGLIQDYERAIADYTSAIELDPEDADAYLARALIYQRSLGEPEKAISDLEAAARLYQEQGRLQEFQRTQNLLDALTN